MSVTQVAGAGHVTVLIMEELKVTEANHICICLCVYNNKGGTRWRIWLRYCGISRKVAGSIPDCVSGISH